jgi:tryptophanyl-tRNA synthetase
MTQDTFLTGITTTGTPHIGNYVGAIRPGIEASKDLDTGHFYFLADYHSLAKNEDPDKIGQSTLEIAAAWMALGLDTEHAFLPAIGHSRNPRANVDLAWHDGQGPDESCTLLQGVGAGERRRRRQGSG